MIGKPLNVQAHRLRREQELDAYPRVVLFQEPVRNADDPQHQLKNGTPHDHAKVQIYDWVGSLKTTVGNKL